jgi:hypothetical protein
MVHIRGGNVASLRNYYETITKNMKNTKKANKKPVLGPAQPMPNQSFLPPVRPPARLSPPPLPKGPRPSIPQSTQVASQYEKISQNSALDSPPVNVVEEKEKLAKVKEGYLDKKSPSMFRINPWDTRYFTLYSDRLTYKDAPNSNKEKGTIMLKDIYVKYSPNEYKKNDPHTIFYLKFIEPGKREDYELKASSKEDAESWITEIIKQEIIKQKIKAAGGRRNTRRQHHRKQRNYRKKHTHRKQHNHRKKHTHRKRNTHHQRK